MDAQDAALFDNLIAVVTRRGMKRTTMADLARGAGVSRQTLYDRFGDKDGIMAAAIDQMAEGFATDLRAALAQKATLADKLDAYFDVIVRPTYETMQAMPDAADFERGMGPASIAAIRRMSDAKKAILRDMLRQHLPADAEPAESVASFVEQSCNGAKMSRIDRAEFETFLSVLKASVVALSREG